MRIFFVLTSVKANPHNLKMAKRMILAQFTSYSITLQPIISLLEGFEWSSLLSFIETLLLFQ